MLMTDFAPRRFAFPMPSWPKVAATSLNPRSSGVRGSECLEWTELDSLRRHCLECALSSRH